MKRQYPTYRNLSAFALILPLLVAPAVTVRESTAQGTHSIADKTVSPASLLVPDGLDTTFGGDGIVQTSFGGTNSSQARSVAIQSDGKIVAAGADQEGTSIHFALIRYNTDGSLDPSFGMGGKVTTSIGVSDSGFYSVALQADGKIVAAGSTLLQYCVPSGCDYDFALTRYNPDGSLDTSFGGDGKVTTPIGTSRNDYAYSVAVQPDGKIVAAGVSGGADADFAVTRYNTDGSLDTSFSGDGMVKTPVGPSYSAAISVAIQSDGKIVAAGSGANDFALVRYNMDGSLDTSFDGDGIVTTPIGPGYNAALAVAIQSDGKIVAAGDSDAYYGVQFALVRCYNPNGSLDTSFNGNGIVTTAFAGSSFDVAFSVAIQSDGKTVAAGYTGSGPTNDFAIVRYNTNGSLDTSFDGDGKVVTPIGTDTDRAYSIAIQSDGKIVAAGDGSYNFALARYNSDGSLDGHGRLQFDSGWYDAEENTSASVSVTRNGSAGAVSASYSFSNGTAIGGSSCTAGVDYINTGGTVDFADGDATPKTINITLCDDAVYQGNRTFDVALSTSTGGSTIGSPGSAVINIRDDEHPQELQFDSSNYSGAENAASIPVTVTRTNGSQGTVSAAYSFSYGDATGGSSCAAGVDYINTAGRVSFADGDTTPKTINVPICDDTSAHESNESFIIALSNPVGVALGSQSSAQVTIINDDTSLQLNSDSYSGVENAASIYVEVWRAGRIAGDVSAAYSFTDGTATGGGSCTSGVDYINTGGTVSFADGGGIYSSINIQLCDDSVYEGNGTISDEVFSVSLSNPTGGATLGTPNSANVTIIEDDPTSPVTLTVNQVGDAGDGVCDASCTLRDAVTTANNRHPSDDTIIFSAPAFSTEQTVTLTSGQLSLSDSVVINGPGANLFSVSCNNTSRAFYVSSGVTARLDGMTIRDGSEGTGGGIYNAGTLTVSNSTVRGNSAVYGGSGGGIYNAGTLIVSDSTVSGNNAPGYYDENGDFHPGIGGGIFNNPGTATIGNTTISGNSADYGGGILNGSGGTLTLTNSTISGNIAFYNGGGIHSGSSEGNETLNNTIVAGNTGGDIGGIIESASHNLIGDAASSGGMQNGVNGNIVGVNALLGPLQNNGGPTKTYALLFGSPAINAGDDCVLTVNGCGDGNPALPTDQRGMPRNGTVDIGAFERQPEEIPSPAPFDFDGDGRSDVSVFRPSDRVWYLNNSTQGFSATQFGLSTDKLTPADYDGDGKTDVSVFRDGIWYWLNSTDGSFTSFRFGLPGDIPVSADYTGDGRAELGVYRDGIWYTWNLANSQFNAVQFGLSTDKPVAADYDGDGQTDQAVYRNGEWHLNRSTEGYAGVYFGLASDDPVPADYDGDGKTDLAVYRDGTWYLQRSSQGFAAFQFGFATDIPAPADYDGDGKSDAAVYRDGTWYLLNSTSGFSAQQFGLPDDCPVPAAFLQ